MTEEELIHMDAKLSKCTANAFTKHNLIQRLRQKGIEVKTKERIIHIPYGLKVTDFTQAERLCREFRFNAEFVIPVDSFPRFVQPYDSLFVGEVAFQRGDMVLERLDKT